MTKDKLARAAKDALIALQYTPSHDNGATVLRYINRLESKNRQLRSALKLALEEIEA